MKIFNKIIILMIVAIMMTGCQSNVPEDTSESNELTISAAASLKDALTEIKDLYIIDKPDFNLTLTFGSSGSLAEQIQQGALVDVFLSASTKYMDDLKNNGLIDETTLKNLLENEVVLIAPDDSEINDFDQLTDSSIKKIGIGEPKTVPAGEYAVQVFDFYKLMDKITDKIVYGKDVREVLTWVETGNVDAGVVYSTDARMSESVRVVKTALSGSHKPIIYPAAIVKSSKNPQAAEEFIEFLSSDKAKEIFEKYGFEAL